MKFRTAMRLCCLLLVAVVAVGCFAGCEKDNPPADDNKDFAGELKLDMSSTTKKAEVTVKLFVDGDTTHFYAKGAGFKDDIVKARYLAINTPESTGKIEEWGKAASRFTRSKLESAVSIIIESDDDKWNIDSTGERTLLWIWYKPAADAEYRNLNLEILQNGLALASNSADNRYGETCVAAIAQARSKQLYVHSKGKKDPDFPYGAATAISLKELRCNIAAYEGVKVAVEGVVIQDTANTVYLESFDEESGRYFGMQVYYGFNAEPGLARALTIGNKVYVVGTVQYYEGGGTYQISGIEYDIMDPTSNGSTHALEGTGAPAFAPITSPDTLNGAQVELIIGDEKKTFEEGLLLQNTSVAMAGLTVKSIWTTQDGDSKGALTLTCEVGGKTLTVRTVVLYDEAGNPVTADAFEGKTIDVKGLVDFYEGKYQIKVFNVNAITVH